MLAQAERPTNDFLALARYLLHGKSRPTHPDRVAWMFAHNLTADDPLLAAKLMEATAELSSRCKNACYHVIIAWAEVERPSPETMQFIAQQALARAGLGQHQAFVMGHGDKAHAHLHMMINRVDPETGRAWSTSHDYRRWDRIMRDLAGVHGFEHVPCHQFDPDLTDDVPKAPTSPAWHAAKRGASTTRMQWSRQASRAFAAKLSEGLDRASTWEDLADAFADHGLTLEVKGKGHVVGNATSYTKLSALGLQMTANGLAKKRHPPSRSKPSTSRPWVDGVDLARALTDMGLADRSVLKDAISSANAQRLAKLAHAPFIVKLLHGLRQQLASTTSHRTPNVKSPSKAPKRRRPEVSPAKHSR
ncbi:MAG: relaxase/mobilization nuclease domain-containing protein [Hyphomicrobiaceae bacterium]|nr:relaxase/mobilization nuclease domain-containing protein [Hyphomicrobiaceae bacterium]